MRRTRTTGLLVVAVGALVCQAGPHAGYTGVGLAGQWYAAELDAGVDTGTRSRAVTELSIPPSFPQNHSQQSRDRRGGRKRRELLSAGDGANLIKTLTAGKWDGDRHRVRRAAHSSSSSSTSVKTCVSDWTNPDRVGMCPKQLPMCAGKADAKSKGKCVAGLINADGAPDRRPVPKQGVLQQRQLNLRKETELAGGKQCEFDYDGGGGGGGGKKMCNKVRPECRGFRKVNGTVEWGRCGLENLKMHRLERQAKASRVKADRIAKMTKRKAARDAQLAANKGGAAGKGSKKGVGRFKFIERGIVAYTNKKQGGKEHRAGGAENEAAAPDSLPTRGGGGSSAAIDADRPTKGQPAMAANAGGGGGGGAASNSIDPHGKGLAHAMTWLLPLLLAAFTWGISEIFCDACIDDGEFDASSVKKEDLAQTLRNLYASIICGGDMFREPAGGGNALMASRGGKLSGEQGTAIAGVVMVPCALFLHTSLPATESIYAHEQSVTILAMVAGVTQGLAALTLYKAYETAPSTLIVPMTQLTAVMTLFVSLVVASIAPRYPDLLGALEGSFITGKDMVAYVIILFGGLYPVAKGNVGEMMKKEFWRQPFVTFVLLNDLFLAVTYEIIAICTSSTGGMSPDMYVVITSYSNVVIYIGIFLVIPTFRTEMMLLGDAGVSYVVLAMGSELCNWLAAWAVTYAYRAHYNSGVVNAAEVSLNQVANLVIAILMQQLCRFGRHSAVTDVKTKVMSCAIVAIGLVITTVDG